MSECPRISTFSSIRQVWCDVEAALPGLGFRYLGVTVADASRRRRRAWVHEQTRVPLELHTSITGIGATPDVVWAMLSRETEVGSIGPGSVEILNRAATALHIVLNVAHHGRANLKTMADLQRALEESRCRPGSEQLSSPDVSTPFPRSLRAYVSIRGATCCSVSLEWTCHSRRRSHSGQRPLLRSPRDSAGSRSFPRGALAFGSLCGASSPHATSCASGHRVPVVGAYG